MKQYLGIDPGASGAIAVVNAKGEAVDHIKLTGDPKQVWEFLIMQDVESAYLEAVHSMPGQGVASTFKFGQSYGMLMGFLVAANIPFGLVRPQAWQKALDCMTGGNKNVTKAAAQALHPDLKITHAIADAYLIAEHTRQQACQG